MGIESFFSLFGGGREVVPVVEATIEQPAEFDELAEIESFPPEIGSELLRIRNLHMAELALKKKMHDFYVDRDILDHLTSRGPDQIAEHNKIFTVWQGEQVRIANEESVLWEKLQPIVLAQPNAIGLQYNQFKQKRAEKLRSENN